MKCPVCKKTIPENALKCPYCKTRTGLLCKNCNTVNSIFDLKCKKCGKQILKTCAHCGSVNFPDAKKCRKCGIPFESVEEPAKIDTLEYRPDLISQKNALTILTQGLLDDDKKIFSLSGEKGIGKSHVLRNAVLKLKEHNFIWMFGKCTPLTLLTPGGMSQYMILNLYDLPNFCINTAVFKKDAASFFRKSASICAFSFSARKIRFSARSFSSSDISASGFRFPRLSRRASTPCFSYFIV